MATWFNVLYSALTIVGTVILLLSFTVSIQSVVYLSIVGYSVLTAACILILSSIFNSSLQASNGQFGHFFSILLNGAGPFVLNACVMLFLLTLMITHKDQLNSGNVSQQYYSFSVASSILILSQFILFYYGVQSSTFKREHRLPVMMNSFSYLLALVNIYIAVILRTILKYYTTDG
jgi:hypothetical protein